MKKIIIAILASLLLTSYFVMPAKAAEAGADGVVYEAEDAELVNNWVYENGYINDETVSEQIGETTWRYVDGYIEGHDVELTPLECSGGKIAGFFNNDESKGGNNANPGSITFTVDIPKDGFYDITFKTFSPHGEKKNDIQIDGGAIYSDMLVTPETESEISSMSIEREFEAGNHTVSILGHWGFTYVDCIIVAPSAARVGKLVGSNGLCAETPTENTVKLANYLSEIYGKSTLSAVCAKSTDAKELKTVYALTGEYPAIVFFDAAEKNAAEYAAEWFGFGGIAGLDFKYTGDEKQLDDIAEILAALQRKDVPVLMRPETENAEAWRTVYDKLVDDCGLNNLIWIWNTDGSAEYPGDGYADIIGGCIYKENAKDYSGSPEKFLELEDIAGPSGKMIGLSKTNVLPDASALQQTGDIYLFVAPENKYLFARGGSLIIDYTEENMAKRFFSHRNVITLRELPETLNENAVRPSGEISSEAGGNTVAIVAAGIGAVALAVACTALVIVRKSAKNRKEEADEK